MPHSEDSAHDAIGGALSAAGWMVAEIARPLSAADPTEHAVRLQFASAKSLRHSVHGGGLRPDKPGSAATPPAPKRAFESKLAPQDQNDEPVKVCLGQHPGRLTHWRDRGTARQKYASAQHQEGDRL